ncbi:alpha-galactosidase [Nocardioides sp. zg-1228]|uniref:alpha-galactosidase n=1 Tax=Nocardioides sp. zg-1228 TaxID=2763008 RepID=UPI001642BE0C|nr:alpha-galactosidase [Nocardioides sp. zg-1228]MBC2932850.1 alpha-galactosidase [Nocardioides sp. zg-1228]QSF56936.1 alpha-galactosidase [Nocardioides sp. zg-1228]
MSDDFPPTDQPGDGPVHLSRGGVSVVVGRDAGGIPAVLHWGTALGDLDAAALSALVAAGAPGVPRSSYDLPRRTGLVPDGTRGFSGTPGLSGHRVGGSATAAAPSLVAWDVGLADGRLVCTSTDDEAGWSVTVDLVLDDAGLLHARTSVTNTADGDLHLASVLTSLPVPARAGELLDLTGRWCRERTPQRHPWVQGTHRRDGRRGRTGHDATLLMVAGTPGFSFSRGEVWAVHTAWSGNHTTYAERTPEGECLLGGGELLSPGEVVLAPSETYHSPRLLASWSGAGLDPLSHRLHAHLRAVTPRARGQRPVIANTWEAVYFDQSLGRLTELADVAASVGVERFVLDDGWFLGRRDDTAALGDWSVDPAVWPHGLGPLVEHVTGAGMEFGLWVEPEMVNLDSRVAQAHPERVLRGRSTPPPEWRHQQVLDLQDDAAYADLRAALLALLDELDIAYLKWDHNRDLTDATHEGRPAVHGQTVAAYRLLDELREAHPALEIESCSSGGARVDAEVLTRADRIWPSDTIDPLERQHLQRWTSLLVPPELMGSHVGGPTSHTTGRTHALRYRAATALLHSFGVEWDLTRVDDAGLAELRSWISLHKQVRPLIGTGTLVHPDHPDPSVMVTGVVAADRSEAWYVVATVGATATQHLAPLRPTGLDPARIYRLTEQLPPPPGGADLTDAWAPDGVELPGRALQEAGVALPVLGPEEARVLRVATTVAR